MAQSDPPARIARTNTVAAQENPLEPRHPDAAPDDAAGWLVPLAVVALTGSALLAAPLLGWHIDPLVLAVVAGLGLVTAGILLARWRFEAFILTLLAVRPLVDGFQPGPQQAGLSPSIAVGLVFVATSVVWLAARWRHGRLRRPSAATVGLGTLVVAAGLSCLVSRLPADSLNGTFRLLAAWLMFAVIEQLLADDEGAHRRLLVALMLATALVTVWALLGVAGGGAFVDPFTGLLRADGPFVHPNVLAKFLAIMVMPLAAYVLWGQRRHRAGAAAFLVPVLLALSLTYARVAWIAAALGLAYLLSRVSWKFIPPLAGILVAAALFVPALRARIADLWAPAPSVGAPENSLVWRLRFWQELLDVNRVSPINGTGLDTIPTLGSQTGLNAHNVWVQSYVEMGLVGLLAMAFAVGSIGWSLHRARRTVPIVRHYVAVAVGLTVLATTPTENVLSETSTIWYAAVLLAAGWAMPQASSHGARPVGQGPEGRSVGRDSAAPPASRDLS